MIAARAAHGRARLPRRARARAAGDDPLPDLRARARGVLGVRDDAGGIAAISLSLTIVAIVVPLNVVFGLVTALALARGRFPGRGLLQAVVDLPFAVSPVVVGVALILFWGNTAGSAARCP